MKIEFTLIGQATVCINLDGIMVMTDPWWGSFELLRAVPLTVDPESIMPIHYMLVSHNHVDHWCKRAIDVAVKRNIPIIGSTSAVKRAVKHKATKVKAMTPGQSVECEGFTVIAVPAFHPMAKDAVGFIIKKDSMVLYFSGDTLYTESLKKALTPYTITIAMVQVACSTYPIIGKDGMDLQQAAQFVRECKPNIVIPIHYQVKGKHLVDETLQQWDVEAQKVILPHGKAIAVTV